MRLARTRRLGRRRRACGVPAPTPKCGRRPIVSSKRVLRWVSSPSCAAHVPHARPRRPIGGPVSTKKTAAEHANTSDATVTGHDRVTRAIVCARARGRGPPFYSEPRGPSISLSRRRSVPPSALTQPATKHERDRYRQGGQINSPLCGGALCTLAPLLALRWVCKRRSVVSLVKSHVTGSFLKRLQTGLKSSGRGRSSRLSAFRSSDPSERDNCELSYGR